MPPLQKHLPIALAAAILLSTPALSAEPLSKEKAAVVASIDAKQDQHVALSRDIWGYAELAFMETQSSKALQDMLEKEGFTIRAGLAGVPTAFVAEWGKGKPVVAFLGEFDALPGLSQQVCAEKKPLVKGTPGHGCGHNLLGVGAAAAAVAVKEWLEKTETPGTVRFYGCPAEERGNGKRFLVQAGLFDDVDAAITWHPANDNSVNMNQTISINTIRFKFHGRPSHASVAPHHGRSALDGVEALDYMVNLMREHVDPGARIHYVITDGGDVPNVVPEHAEVFYWVRHHDMKTLNSICARIAKAAEGAAMGTGTRVEYKIKDGSVSTRLNKAISEAALKNMQALDPIEYTAEELALMRRFFSRLRRKAAATRSRRVLVRKRSRRFRRRIRQPRRPDDLGQRLLPAPRRIAAHLESGRLHRLLHRRTRHDVRRQNDGPGRCRRIQRPGVAQKGQGRILQNTRHRQTLPPPAGRAGIGYVSRCDSQTTLA